MQYCHSGTFVLPMGTKYGKCWKIPKEIPHNGARRFVRVLTQAKGWKMREYFVYFPFCTIGAKDPPKPAVPIVRCCPKC